MVKTATGFVIFRKIQSKIEYLLLQTSYGINHWTPPKGHVDPGESELETAYRETQEEAGLVKTDFKVFDDCKQVLNYNVNGKPKIVIYWLAELINKKAEIKLSDEHIKYVWSPLKEACELVEFKETQELLRNCQIYIDKNLSA